MFEAVARTHYKPAPTREARGAYVSWWAKLKQAQEDTSEFARAWDEVCRLEGLFEFSTEDFRSMRKRASLRAVGAQKG